MKTLIILTTVLVSGVSLFITPDIVADELKSLERRVERVEKRASAQNQLYYEAQDKIYNIQDQIAELNGKLDVLTYQINEVVERQRKLYKELSYVQDLYKEGIEEAIDDEVLSESDSYSYAINLATKDKKADEAINAFKSFLKAYPNSIYVPNAKYWLGQLYYNKKEYDLAYPLFLSLVNDYQNSSKRADALFKLAIIDKLKNNTSSFNKWYRMLLQEYPDSNISKLAKKYFSSQ